MGVVYVVKEEKLLSKLGQVFYFNSSESKTM